MYRVYQGDLYREVFLQSHRVGKRVIAPLSISFQLHFLNLYTRYYLLRKDSQRSLREVPRTSIHMHTGGRAQLLSGHLNSRPSAKPYNTPENPAALFYCSQGADKFYSLRCKFSWISRLKYISVV